MAQRVKERNVKRKNSCVSNYGWTEKLDAKRRKERRQRKLYWWRWWRSEWFIFISIRNSIGKMKLLHCVVLIVLRCVVPAQPTHDVAMQQVRSMPSPVAFSIYFFRHRAVWHSSLDLWNNDKTMKANEIRRRKFIGFTVSLTWKRRSSGGGGPRGNRNERA